MFLLSMVASRVNKEQPPKGALQAELETAGAKLQALQSEMQKLQKETEELRSSLKSARNDVEQVQKESQVGHVTLCMSCAPVLG